MKSNAGASQLCEARVERRGNVKSRGLMLVHVLAVDYDGTIAHDGRLAETTAAALVRVRESGRKVVLVTGRMLPDLRQVCPDVDRLFDAVVAENGALLYLPSTREVRTLGDPPEPALVEALRRRQVRLDLGSSILASDEVFAEAALAAIREVGVERTLVFNKGALMLLPGGVTKGTGLGAALGTMQLSTHNTAAVGDAENDHAFLSLSELAVAVADAIPALRERADVVLTTGNGTGVTEFIDRHLLSDARDLLPRLARHWIPLGDRTDGTPVAIPAHAVTLLVVGPSATGKSTLTGVLVERVVQAGRSFCLLDPEGDYDALAELPGTMVLGGKGTEALPAADELEQLLRRPAGALVLNLSGMTMADKVAYATRALGVIGAVQTTHGLPHWLVVDEAHHLFPAEGSAAVAALPEAGGSLALITLEAERLAPELRRRVTALASTDAQWLGGALAVLNGGTAALEPGDENLERGEAVLASLDDSPPRPVRFRLGRRQVHHRRHVKKYTEGELPPDRSFYFRGAEGALNLRAANLTRFVELAEGVDEGTWTYHLQRGDYSRWLREMIKDPDLAEEITGLEAATLPTSEARRRVLDAVRARYSV
jgi:hydroxymethylpyrimidine pyrophosphatase-like HAD family hydrolase